MLNRRRAHNSKAPEVINYRGKVFLGPTSIYQSTQNTPAVSLQTFSTRFSRLAMNGMINDSNIDEALYLDVDAFRAKYSCRKTYVDLDGKRVNLQNIYETHSSDDDVSYENFRKRCLALREKNLLSMQSVMDALKFDPAQWRTWYGGGKRRAFVYNGEEYPEQAGRSFRSISSFLDAIGRHDERPLIWSRLKSGWNFDDALAIPIAHESKRSGTIYKITRIKTGQVYVGLTVTTVEQRWAIHIRRALSGSRTKLAAAIRDDGKDGFTVSILEEGISDTTVLSQRERFWAEQLHAYGEMGLNTAPAGGLGGPRGSTTIIDGEKFRSMNEASEIIAERTGIASHAVLKRLKKGIPIPCASEVRVHSKHPEAGSNLFRRWLGLLKRHPKAVDERWVLSYDAFKVDVSPVPERMELIRLDDKLSWGPGNVRWVSTQEKIERIHGKELFVKGITYPTLKAVSDVYGIGVSTLQDRIRRQGMSIDEAVQKGLGVTSYKRDDALISVDGLTFRSKRQAILHLSRIRGWSEDKAKYRFSIGDFEPDK